MHLYVQQDKMVVKSPFVTEKLIIFFVSEENVLITICCVEKNQKVAEHGQNKTKIDLLKGDVYGFSYLSLIFSYFIF
jgi:hypothetical protein